MKKVRLLLVCLLSAVLIHGGSGMVVVRCMMTNTVHVAAGASGGKSCCSARQDCRCGGSCMVVETERLSPFSQAERRVLPLAVVCAAPLCSGELFDCFGFRTQGLSCSIPRVPAPLPRDYLNRIGVLLI